MTLPCTHPGHNKLELYINAPIHFLITTNFRPLCCLIALLISLTNLLCCFMAQRKKLLLLWARTQQKLSDEGMTSETENVCYSFLFDQRREEVEAEERKGKQMQGGS